MRRTAIVVAALSAVVGVAALAWVAGVGPFGGASCSATPAQVLPSVPGVPSFGVHAAGDQIVFRQESAPGVWTVPREGGDPRRIEPTPSVGGTRIWWANQTAEGLEVRALDLARGAWTTVVVPAPENSEAWAITDHLVLASTGSDAGLRFLVYAHGNAEPARLPAGARHLVAEGPYVAYAIEQASGTRIHALDVREGGNVRELTLERNVTALEIQGDRLLVGEVFVFTGGSRLMAYGLADESSEQVWTPPFDHAELRLNEEDGWLSIGHGQDTTILHLPSGREWGIRGAPHVDVAAGWGALAAPGRGGELTLHTVCLGR